MQEAYAPVPMSLELGPHRRRRSSISEHIQRVFRMDRPERSCSRYKEEGQFTSPEIASVQHEEACNSHQHQEKTIYSFIFPERQYVSNETEHNSFTPSAQLPTNSADPSPTVVKLSSDDTASQSQSMRPSAPIDIEGVRNTICVSPTWAKDNSRKERRATRRLEMERRELEKRLQKLEEDQTRFEHGIYERTSRRLTKKQPAIHSSRSSSASTDRPRSLSGPLSSVFSSSRRSSWSRSSSVDGHGFAFLRRRSVDVPNRRHMENSFDTTSGPPVLPLVLPERFGTDISKDLASRYAALLPSPIQPSPVQRSLHTTTKSDDLHESWMAAQAWQRENGGQEVSAEVLGQRQENDTTVQDNSGARHLNGDASPTAKGRKSDLPTSPAGHTTQTDSLATESLATQNGMTSQRKTMQPENYQHVHTGHPVPSKVTTARQIQELRSSMNGQASASTRNLPPALTIKVPPMGIQSKKSRAEASLHNHPRTYKSSPLASNSTTTENIDKKEEMNSTKPSTSPHSATIKTQPSRFSGHHSDEENRGINRLSVSPMKTEEMTQNRTVPRVVSGNQSFSNGSPQLLIRSQRRHPDGRHGRTSSFDATSQHTAGLAVTPLNVKVSTQSKRPTAGASVAESQPICVRSENSQAKPAIAGHASSNIRDGQYRAPHSVEAIETGNGMFQDLLDMRESVRSRASSRDSSHGAHSDYDTADEELPDTPQSQSRGQSICAPGSKTPVSVPDTPITEETRRPSISERPTRMNVLRKKTLPKAKALQKDQVMAKVFVICCHCRYWHDMPSEVYAKLACPERLAMGLRSRISTRRSSVPSQDKNDTRKTPMPGRFQPFSTNSTTQSTQASTDTSPSPVNQPSSLQCCWCGHAMNKFCCQGWTAIVQMQKRHH